MDYVVSSRDGRWAKILDEYALVLGWLALHIAILVVLSNHRDLAPVFLSFSASYIAFLILVVGSALSGAVFLLRPTVFHPPLAVVMFRSKAIVRLVGWFLGTAIIVAIWTTPLPTEGLNSLQQEAIHGW